MKTSRTSPLERTSEVAGRAAGEAPAPTDAADQPPAAAGEDDPSDIADALGFDRAEILSWRRSADAIVVVTVAGRKLRLSRDLRIEEAS